MDGAPAGLYGPEVRSAQGTGTKYQILIRNVAPHIKERDLHHLLMQVGVVRHVQMMAPVAIEGHFLPTYAVAEFSDHSSATTALSYLHGFMLGGYRLDLQHFWNESETTPLAPSDAVAFSSDTRGENRPNCLYSVFVGDLCPGVDDNLLTQTFSRYSSMYDARVIRDLQTQTSRGYGFVRFRKESDAMDCIAKMSGQWLGSRIIRVNWADRPSEPYPTKLEERRPSGELPLHDTGPDNATLYIGNLPPNTPLHDLMSIFCKYGDVINAQVFPGRHYAFISFQYPASAMAALQAFQSNPLQLSGYEIKIGWARYGYKPSTSRR